LEDKMDRKKKHIAKKCEDQNTYHVYMITDQCRWCGLVFRLGNACMANGDHL
ncbi:hypothetical protein ACJX0J_040830, partial [Zea mays]